MTTQKLFNPRFLLISLGNPAPYKDTLHSAGHHALKHLQALLPAQPPFHKTDAFGQSCQASRGNKYTLVQSPTLMNVSGAFTSKAWQRELARQQDDPAGLHLVVVHDDLEEELGVVKMRKWGSSHRGHNGIKSIAGKLREGDYPGAKWARISVGIGRPDERSRATVSDYVLRPMTIDQIMTLEDTAAPGVLRCLDEWEAKLAAQAKK
ncbi:putative peptidyl-tRNA hydrolase [Colletotrichum karsti]|uniref:peptidyl-tRNA hydrolase n=1 Tax=Colletotrichum karsti TaxID=1095194 RepID=A0A9P6LDH7_9PEZI|nr:putative peptidyl-tRNA hydrolase [Colletotrichum karsti]KAF9871739.1 putative peptidyl-tRNA hydrolase [Colletotrichum karsti]